MKKSLAVKDEVGQLLDLFMIIFKYYNKICTVGTECEGRTTCMCSGCVG